MSEFSDILEAEACKEDIMLSEETNEILVLAKNKDGQHYVVGGVSMDLVYQDPKAALAAINHIKFGKLLASARNGRDLEAGDE